MLTFKNGDQCFLPSETKVISQRKRKAETLRFQRAQWREKRPLAININFCFSEFYIDVAFFIAVD